ncbi:MAG: DNA polymerase III, subunit gamma and tau [Planctomycetes bacterium RBG_13_63_9]|nr:MAG: DNA polymerase III, subunit gamma and tau [Planctomycetes bacterium RBG_13_63_9]
MSDSSSNAEPPPTGSTPADRYVVIARRYRPQVFDELVGQEHVAQALSGAISTNRVGHAYLFTGARGVGKTSAARILAKALNCEKGPAVVPCNQCDTCRSIATGDDIDVLEIDGASNRGIDEIRQLRQTVNVRPSRSRLKIYIIDEVHMLTREAFNALLKTLEEPPGHVKFIFCTTEPTKIPVTILSRCQRFDFAGILTTSIAQRLGQIVESEGVEADSEALDLLARRATGSMRDGQSLLEQLLAFAPGRITLGDVHQMLGTAGESRLGALAGHLIERNAAAALAELDVALSEGVDVAQLLEQLLGYFRDCMAAAMGCPVETSLYTSATQWDEVGRAGNQLGLSTLLAVMQILDQALSRLRFSTQGRILAELALVRISSLEQLEELPALIAQLRSGSGSGLQSGSGSVGASGPRPVSASRTPPRPKTASTEAPSVQTPPDDGSSTTSAGRRRVELTPASAEEAWTRALERMSGMVVEQAKEFQRVTFAEPDSLVIHFKPRYALAKSSCERPDQVARFERALAEVTGRQVRVRFVVQEDEAGASEPAGTSARTASSHQRLLEAMNHPMICRAGELFGAQPIRVDAPPSQE